MNQAQIKGKWEQVKGSAKKVWGDLTEDDFTKAQGSVEKLYGLIHEKYGDSKEVITDKLEKAQSQAKEASQNLRSSTKEMVEATVGRMENQLAQWGARLDELLKKAGEMGAEARSDYHKRLDDLKEKLRATQGKFSEFKSAGLDRWESFKSGMEKVWNELESAFKSLGNNNNNNSNNKN